NAFRFNVSPPRVFSKFLNLRSQTEGMGFSPFTAGQRLLGRPPLEGSAVHLFLLWNTVLHLDPQSSNNFANLFYLVQGQTGTICSFSSHAESADSPGPRHQRRVSAFRDRIFSNRARQRTKSCTHFV